ncbi:glycine--tRNA ligase subunit beta [Mangrovihabitans endophyticus]|uniref:glycine--tRNA ligase n=1 Tax=Mangrovihabitans endophyticus TaxID=1751298 RepID=A0A8J3C0D0_9ACTN|nr:glycine--tRNA ligase subunit beta [Mangrovihabitans endophyticus]GGL00609.1 hypothetical protein GCM10012284_38870 [Mangrovihabitans endophyticus]
MGDTYPASANIDFWAMLTLQEAAARLTAYWTDEGCLPPDGSMNARAAAGTPDTTAATFLLTLAPEAGDAQGPGDAQDLCLGSLCALGIDVAAHDVRFVADDWPSPASGEPGPAWTVWLDGLEIGQVACVAPGDGRTPQAGTVRITYALDRIVTARQRARHTADLEHAAAPAAAVPAPAPTSTTSDRARTLVVEVGVAEMPPAQARTAVEQLRRGLADALAANRLAHGEVHGFVTPRRLIAVADAVAARPSPTGRDAPRVLAGAVDRAAGAVDTAAGAVAQVAGAVAQAIGGVAQAIGGVARSGGGVPGDGGTSGHDAPRLTLTRPVRWLVALWGHDVVPVTVSSFPAGRGTRGPRTADRPVLEVASAETFMETIAVNGVVADPEDRRDLIMVGAQDLVYPDGRIDAVADSALIDQISHLVEQPVPLLGTFDPDHLELPEAALTAVIREQQRCLPVRDADGVLLPWFVAVADGPVDVPLVRAGNEAALQDRLTRAAAG